MLEYVGPANHEYKRRELTIVTFCKDDGGTMRMVSDAQEENEKWVEGN